MQNDNSNDFMIEVFKFCLEKGKFKLSDFNEKFDLNTGSSIDLIGRLIYEGAVDETNEVAVYCVTEGVTLEEYIKFKNSNNSKIKETKANTSKIKIVKENTPTSQRVLALVTIAVVLISFYFLSRSIIWMIVMAVLTFFAYYFSPTVEKKFPHALILSIYIVGMPIINFITPIVGEKYEQRVALEKANRILKDMEYESFQKVSMAEYSVKKMLKDPSSAEFSNGRLGNKGAVCGHVNAKNSFGAYAGKQRYVSSNGLNMIDNGESDFESVWEKFCQ
ncbi:hypothetical protein [Xenorhabdus bharatensis]|uniref:hypothetical protein n=1 Tax=Xenorhabdus bharatensis TaxID=3136256 RepID=UPI0030F3BDA3